MGVLDSLKKRVGETGEVIDAGLAWAERDMVKSADSGVPVVSQLGKILQPVAVGIRAAVANTTSGGGKYYQPEVRDERYFSKDAKREIAEALAKNGDRGVGRYDYKGDAAGWEASQALGGASVKDGKLIDVFDVNRKDPYGLVTYSREAAETFASKGEIGKAVAIGTLGNLAEMGHRALGTVFGGDNDPDKGKVRMEIPLAELKKYRQAAKGGKASGEPQPTDVPPAPAESSGGPRIVINPSTFRNEKDAMCVAWNEALRVVMEETGFEPVSEPTEEQRRFFADTDYADDELQLRRTILARICTFDTSVKDPTDEQVQEAVEFVRSVMEGGFPRNEWEQSCLKKILDVLSSVPTAPNDGSPRTPVEPQQDAEPGATAAELGGQTQKEEERDLRAGKAVEPDPKYDAQGPAAGPQKDSEVPLNVEKQENRDLTAGGAILADPKNDAAGPAVKKEDELK